MTVDQSPSVQLLELAATGLPRPAIEFALELETAGRTVDCLITEVLAPTQQQVGALWAQNEWSVAEEHAATSVVDGVLGALALRTTLPALPLGSVLVACVEEEYHTLPARMGAERLRSAGWDVVFLGGSLPADDVQRFAAVAKPDVVVFSCTVPLFLPGARRCIGAIADLGLPAVAAGAAFGDSPARAIRLGASGWIGAGVDPSSVLTSGIGPAGPAQQPDAEAVALELQADEVQAASIAEMFVRIPQMAGYTPRQLARTRADLAFILRYLVVAMDMDDASLFDQFICWLAGILASRDVPDSVLDLSLEVTAEALERFNLRRAATLCSSATPTRALACD